MKKRKGSSDDDEDVGGEKAAERAAVASAAASGPFNNPFAALKAHPIAGTAAPSDEAKPAPADTKRVPAPARAVVRMERKGHGGKECTVIEQLELNPRDLERWLKSLKTSLGCGGSIDGKSIILQGDHRERLKTLLADRGVKKISVG